MPREDGYKNLIPITERTPEEQRAIRAKGSYERSNKKKKEKAYRKLLEEELCEEISVTIETDDGPVVKKISLKRAVMKSLIDACLKGDIKAIELSRKILGEDEDTQRIEITGKDGKDLVPARVLTPAEAAKMMASMDNEF